ncbi:flagellar protein FliT [Pontibacillus sp. HMF3514]|uniref:flagellar protein FliT n=1 Tax=Pontibacillus sp. HMF3514 TaxID=2692425 RepID=UPI00132049FA|nr:flagellar protein FliT [Pontibacillus sp. HMF3514]QHE53589.1 flagellar protein FliT [Pontibacillus sp. HMF3514]
MNQIETLHDVTSELYDLLQTIPSSEEREGVIEKINELLDQREELLNGMEGPYSDEEKRLGKEILHMNETIQIQVQSLMKQVKMDMANVKKQKTSNQKYTNPYQNLNNFDGMFLDKKK